MHVKHTLKSDGSLMDFVSDTWTFICYKMFILLEGSSDVFTLPHSFYKNEKKKK